jgi:hypothetical protein
MFSIDINQPQFYIIYYNGVKLCKISKSNSLNKVLKFFNINNVKSGA